MKDRWNKGYFKLGLVLTISLCICSIFGKFIQEWERIVGAFGKFVSALTPFIVGLVLAFLLNPIMVYLRRGFAGLASKYSKKMDYDKAFRVSKTPCLIMTIILFLLLMAGIIRLIIPNLVISIKDLYDNMPTYLENAQTWVEKMFAKNEKLEGQLNNIIEFASEKATVFLENSILPNMDEILITVSGGLVTGVTAIFNFLVGIIVAIYLLNSKDIFIAQGKKIVYCIFPKRTGNRILEGLNYANSVFGGFINGKIIDSLIIGILCYIFTAAVGMKYAVLISTIVGVTNVIPFFGPFIGAIPGALLALMDEPIMFFIFVPFVLVLQQFDGNILGPLILGDSTGLSGLWVLVAILVGGDLFGVAGMILGVPVFACLYAFFAVQLRDKLREKNLSSKTEDYFRLKGFDEETGEPIYRKKHDFVKRSIKKGKKKSKHKDEVSDKNADEKLTDAMLDLAGLGDDLLGEEMDDR